MMVDSKVIETEEFLDWPVIGKGAERTCYQTPDAPTRCIKVSKTENSKQTRREIKYFEQLKKRGCPFEHIPKYYGKVITSNYLVIEQEVIRDENGKVERSLLSYVKNGGDIRLLFDAINELKMHLIELNIIPCDLVITNILYSKYEKKLKLYLIDGLGSTELIPLSNAISILGKIKIERKFNVFIHINLRNCIKKNNPKMLGEFELMISEMGM